MNSVSNKRNSICIAVFFLSIFTFTFILTELTPLIADDFNYAFTWSNAYIRVENLSMLIESMRIHRNITHGRVFAQGWVTLFMMFPRWVFSLANAAVITLLYISVLHYFQRTGTERPVVAASALAALYWICMPAFGQVFLWLSGACNYIWGTAFALLLIETTASLKSGRRGMLTTLLLLPLAFAVGAWSEHISFATIIIQFLLFIRLWNHTKKLPICEGVLLLCSGTGYLFLMLAPSMLGSNLGNNAVNIVTDRLYVLSDLAAKYWWILPFLIVLVAVTNLHLKKKPSRKQRITVVLSSVCIISWLGFVVSFCQYWSRGGLYRAISSTPVGFLLLFSMFLSAMQHAVVRAVKREVIIDAVIFCVAGLGALALFLMFAQYIPGRGFCAPVVFIGLATVRLCSELDPENHKWISFVLLSVFLLCFCLGVADIGRVQRAAVERYAEIKTAQNSDGILVAVPYPERTKYSAQYGLQDLAEGEHWPNDVMGVYYGLKKVVVSQETQGRS